MRRIAGLKILKNGNMGMHSTLNDLTLTGRGNIEQNLAYAHDSACPNGPNFAV